MYSKVPLAILVNDIVALLGERTLLAWRMADKRLALPILLHILPGRTLYNRGALGMSQCHPSLVKCVKLTQWSTTDVELSSLKHVERLTIHDVACARDALANLSHLNYLCIVGSRITKQTLSRPVHVDEFVMMEPWLNEEIVLDLRHVKRFTMKVIPHQTHYITNKTFCNYTHLETLCLSCVNITDDTLLQCECITKLSLDYCSITDRVLRHFSGARTVKLFCCASITDYGIQNLRSVTKLHLINCTAVHGKTLASLSSLEKLKISGNRHINDSTFAPLTRLNFLSLLSCIHITSAVFVPLRQITAIELQWSPMKPIVFFALDNLQRIGLFHVALSDIALYAMAHCHTVEFRKCKGLTSNAYKLLRGCRKLVLDTMLATEDAFVGMENLLELVLYDCDRIKDEAFLHMPKLDEVMIFGCAALTAKCVPHLLRVQNVSVSKNERLQTAITEDMIATHAVRHDWSIKLGKSTFASRDT